MNLANYEFASKTYLRQRVIEPTLIEVSQRTWLAGLVWSSCRAWCSWPRGVVTVHGQYKSRAAARPARITCPYLTTIHQ